MNPIDLSFISPRGELASRSALLAARLELPLYRPDAVFKPDGVGWPGDNEGRTILALTLLARSTNKEPAYLDEIIRRIPQPVSYTHLDVYKRQHTRSGPLYGAAPSCGSTARQRSHATPSQ